MEIRKFIRDILRESLSINSSLGDTENNINIIYKNLLNNNILTIGSDGFDYNSFDKLISLSDNTLKTIQNKLKFSKDTITQEDKEQFYNFIIKLHNTFKDFKYKKNVDEKDAYKKSVSEYFISKLQNTRRMIVFIKDYLEFLLKNK